MPDVRRGREAFAGLVGDRHGTRGDTDVWMRSDGHLDETKPEERRGPLRLRSVLRPRPHVFPQRDLPVEAGGMTLCSWCGLPADGERGALVFIEGALWHRACRAAKTGTGGFIPSDRSDWV